VCAGAGGRPLSRLVAPGRAQRRGQQRCGHPAPPPRESRVTPSFPFPTAARNGTSLAPPPQDADASGPALRITVS
jgi:hypothetical protein